MQIGDEMEVKEKDLYLAKLLEKNAIKQDEFEDIKYKPEINAFDSKYLKQSFVDKINFGWSVWQEQATPEGFVLVPKEATKEMIKHGYEAHDCFFTLGSVRNVWDAMIEAQEQSHDNSN